MNPQERRFAWCWLLPAKHRPVCIAGFDEEEGSFLRKNLFDGTVVQDPRAAHAWIVDADGECRTRNGPLSPKISHNIRWVAVVGSGRSVRGWRKRLAEDFAGIREYGLMPPSNPRVVVPLAPPRQTATALALHSPGRWFARGAQQFARALVQFGIFFPLRGRVLLIATREGHIWPAGAVHADVPAHLDGENWEYALYLGTPDANRKTTILPLGASAPDVIVKVGSSPESCMALRNEAAALTALGSTPVGSQVPEVKGIVENHHGLALYQEYRQRRRVPRRGMEPAVVDFLAELSLQNRRCRPLRDLLQEIAGTSRDASENNFRGEHVSLLRWLEARADRGEIVWEHRTHGDFAPWNCAWTDRGLFVYDWEDSRSLGLALSDAFYYAVAPAIHIQHRPDPSRTLKTALALAERVANRAGLHGVDLKIHLALWLTTRQAEHRLYGEIGKLLERAVA